MRKQNYIQNSEIAFSFLTPNALPGIPSQHFVSRKNIKLLVFDRLRVSSTLHLFLEAREGRKKHIYFFINSNQAV